MYDCSAKIVSNNPSRARARLGELNLASNHSLLATLPAEPNNYSHTARHPTCNQNGRDAVCVARVEVIPTVRAILIAPSFSCYFSDDMSITKRYLTSLFAKRS